jgi:peptidoglycan/xylan/chitin deacetylase (PgdA/CDA1 family)
MTRWHPVLMYHAVARVAKDPNSICVSPEGFEAQMLHLKRRGLRGVSMSELMRAVRWDRAAGLVGLTFDDGYENFLHAALPVLEGFGFTATLFVIGGMLGGENSWDEEGPRMRLLDACGVREAAARGIEIGAHGVRHVKLSGLDDPVSLREEVEAGRRILGEVLGRPVEGFCYPYGDLNGRAARAVRQAGYAYACAYKAELRHGAYAIPRIYAGERDKGLWFGLKLRWLPTMRWISSQTLGTRRP